MLPWCSLGLRNAALSWLSEGAGSVREANRAWASAKRERTASEDYTATFSLFYGFRFRSINQWILHLESWTLCWFTLFYVENCRKIRICENYKSYAIQDRQTKWANSKSMGAIPRVRFRSITQRILHLESWTLSWFTLFYVENCRKIRICENKSYVIQDRQTNRVNAKSMKKVV